MTRVAISHFKCLNVLFKLKCDGIYVKQKEIRRVKGKEEKHRDGGR